MFLIYTLIGITALISYKSFEDSSLKNKLLFNAYAIFHKKQYYRALSHALIHADWNHLIFNMLTLYFFADTAIAFFGIYIGHGNFMIGNFIFLILYITGAVAASIPAMIKHKDNTWYNSLGASGAVSAVLFATIFFDPWVGIMFILIPVPIPGFIFGFIYIAASSYLDKKGGDNVAHDAHIAGAVYGFLFPIFINPSLFTDVFLESLLG